MPLKLFKILKNRELASVAGLALLLLCCSSDTKRGAAPFRDVLKNYEELTQKYKENQDYKIIAEDRKSKTVVMSLHGCKIEPGTTELARAISEQLKSKLYVFCGLLNRQHDEEHLFDGELHITSTHFNEPRLEKFVSTSAIALSIHGYGNSNPDFCLGGSNETLRKTILTTLQKTFPQYTSCELCCPPYHGLSDKNPVNQTDQKGVQIEMSPSLRQQILKNEALKNQIAHALKSVIR